MHLYCCFLTDIERDREIERTILDGFHLYLRSIMPLLHDYFWLCSANMSITYVSSTLIADDDFHSALQTHSSSMKAPSLSHSLSFHDSDEKLDLARAKSIPDCFHSQQIAIFGYKR